MSWFLNATWIIVPMVVGAFVTWYGWKLENGRQRARKMAAVGRLAGGVAHDFNNLLTAIEFCAQELMEAPADDERNQLLAQDILEACARGAAITGELRDVGQRGDQGVDVVDISALLEQWMPVFHRMVGADVRLTLDAEPLSPVQISATQLHRVVMNLVVNAANAVATHGTITITVAQVGSQVVLTVADDGCGIPRALQPQIFEPFVTTDAQHGTGLGLSVVHGVVHQVGGAISLRSSGRGTTFTLCFPRQPALSQTEPCELHLMSPLPVQRRSGEDTLLPPSTPTRRPQVR